MKAWIALGSWLLALALPILPARAAYTSLYVFGDGVSATTDNQSGLPYYYGGRYCNGRVWVEVLAQRLGLTLTAENNQSFFGHYSWVLTNSVNHLAAPDADTALFIVWVSAADFYDALANSAFQPYNSNNIAVWDNAINRSLSNHLVAVEALYAKGVRTLVMPTAADVTTAPYYTIGENNERFVRERVIDFNARFRTALSAEQAARPDLKIIIPDFFATADSVIGNPKGFGMTNSTEAAIFTLPDPSMNGPGTNFVFWDDLHPSARTQEILADTALQTIAPVCISAIVSVGKDRQLSITNVPIGLSGAVEATRDFVDWAPVGNITCTNATQTVTLPDSGPIQFYRLCFPFSWTWP